MVCMLATSHITFKVGCVVDIANLINKELYACFPVGIQNNINIVVLLQRRTWTLPMKLLEMPKEKP